METALQKMGAIRRMADGGLVSPWSLKGLANKVAGAVASKPAETVSEKYARQDAERAKAAPAATAPAPAAAPAPNTISGYAAGSAMQAREKAAGLKGGGAIKGKGTGTSDDVPIMASNGEFVIKAKAVKALGVEALEALNSIADKPEEKDSKAEAKREYGSKGKPAMKCGGAIRKMATGGLINEDDQKTQSGGAVFGLYPQLTDNQRTTYATADKLRSGVVATGPSSFQPAISNASAPQAPIVGGGSGLRMDTNADPRVTAMAALQSAPTAPTAPVAAAPVVPTAPVDGQVIRNGNSFSGTNVTGNQVSSLDTSQGYAQDLKDLARIDATKAAEQANAVSQEQYAQNAMLQDRALRGNRGAGAIRLQNQTNATTLRGQDQQAQAQGAIQKLAQQKFGLEQAGATLDNAAKTQIQAAQTKLLAAKTPEERMAAEDNLRALQGKYDKTPPPEQYAYAPGGQAVDPATGQTVTQPGVIYNKQTGEIKGPQAAPKQAQNFEKGKTYTDAKGRKAVWDGQKFVPA